MSSQSDKPSRFEATAEQARRGFKQARRHFDRARTIADPYLKKARGFIVDAWLWGAERVPGGKLTLGIALGIVLFVLFVWAITPGGKQDMRGGPGMGGPQPVGVAAALKGDIEVTLNALGTVTPLASVAVRPQVSGQILRIDFTEGQLVKAGDVLAEIDPRSYQAAHDQARGQLARDRAQLTNARLDLKRQQALYEAKATSQQALDTQAAQVRQYRGTVMADEATVATAAINLGYTKITSPVAGRAGLRQIDVGNYVSAGQATGIVVVTQLEPISVLFTVPEDNVGEVIARLHSGAELRVDAYDRNQTAKIASGKLTAVDTQVDTTTGTVKLRALFDNADGALFPNQFVNVRLLVNTLHGQTVVPAAAIQRGAEGTYVFVVKPDQTVAMRTVTLGHQQDERIAVIKGLNVGETVVTDGGDRLSDGMPVTLPSGKKIDAKVAPAENARETPRSAEDERRALFRKLKPEEHEMLRAMSPEDRRAWLQSHRDELMKREEQPFMGFGPGGHHPPGGHRHGGRLPRGGRPPF